MAVKELNLKPPIIFSYCFSQYLYLLFVHNEFEVNYVYKSTSTDPSLTLTNLAPMMENVKDYDSVRYIFNIPDDVFDEIYNQDSNKSKLKEILSEWYLNNHPAPSWQHIADGLYCCREHEALEVLRTLYLNG